MKDVLCFGDSNTWGFVPGRGVRYDEHTRWTGVLQDALGASWRVHEDGVNGRTSCFDDAVKPFLNGRRALPAALVGQKPIDVLVLSLGTNDLKGHTARQAAMGVAQLVRDALAFDVLYPSKQPVFKGEKHMIVLSPIQVWQGLEELNPSDQLAAAHAESCRFPEVFHEVMAGFPVTLLDAQQLAAPSHVDGVHMEAEGHRAIGLKMAQILSSLV